MKADKIVKKQIVNLPVYETGKPIEYVAREFGLDPDGILKICLLYTSDAADEL